MSTRNPAQFRSVVTEILSGSATISVGAVAATTTNVSNTISVPGVVVGDVVLAVVASAALGAVHVQGEVTAADTVTLKVANTTAGSITPPASTVYTAIVAKLQPQILT